MFAVISPAKTLDFNSPLGVLPDQTLPRFLTQSQQLIERLKQLDPVDMARLMKVSDKIALLNVEQVAVWQKDAKDDALMRAAAFAYRGDTYQGLGVDDFTPAQLQAAQARLRIISGLYGLLRPLDRICAYRLEMKTPLTVGAHKNLYQFWGDTLTQALAKDMAEQGSKVVVNLASNEYSSAIDARLLGKPLITPVFEDEKDGHYKVISFYAKRARGAMAAWIIKHEVTRPEQLAEFDVMGYRHVPSLSTAERPVFRRSDAKI